MQKLRSTLIFSVFILIITFLVPSQQALAQYLDMGEEIQATPEEIEEFNRSMDNLGIPSYEEMEELLKNTSLQELEEGVNVNTLSGGYVAIPWSTVPYHQLKSVINNQCAANTQAKYVLGDSFRSVSGSNIIMPSGKGWKNYGFCHIYEGHMKNNILGKVGYTSRAKSQFQAVYNPYATIDIMRNVIDLQPNYVRVDSYKIYKQRYNAREGQTVRVVLYDPKGWSTVFGKYKMH